MKQGLSPTNPSALFHAETSVWDYWSQYTDPSAHQGSPEGMTWEEYFQGNNFPAQFPLLYTNDMAQTITIPRCPNS